MLIPRTFHYGFYIVAPALENYRYQLFTISHDIPLYPVIFHLDGEIVTEIGLSKDTLIVESQDEFLNILEKILKLHKTLTIIQALLAQSMDYSPKAAA